MGFHVQHLRQVIDIPIVLELVRILVGAHLAVGQRPRCIANTRCSFQESILHAGRQIELFSCLFRPFIGLLLAAANSPCDDLQMLFVEVPEIGLDDPRSHDPVPGVVGVL